MDLLTAAVIERVLQQAMESFLAKAHMFFQDWKARRRNMKILVIGDCGSGKTTLVNNLQGDEIAQELLHPSSLLSKVYSRVCWLLHVIVTNCALDLLYIIIVCVHACMCSWCRSYRCAGHAAYT